MNKENAHLYLPLVKALADGKTIQIISAGSWSDVLGPSFSDPPENYRIKPEPREWDAWTTDDGKLLTESDMSEYHNWRKIRVREILD